MAGGEKHEWGWLPMGPTIKGGFLPNRGAYQLREVSYLIREAY